MLIGYARVSTQDQNLELQREALLKTGCQKIFEDKIEGSHIERPGLNKTMEILREGDTLVVWKLDRLGRSVKNLVDLVANLAKQGIHFKSLTDSIDTTRGLISNGTISVGLRYEVRDKESNQRHTTNSK